MTDTTITKDKTCNYIDGRSLKRTGRIVQFSTKVHPSFKIDIAKAAQITGKNYNQILEESLRLYLVKIDPPIK